MVFSKEGQNIDTDLLQNDVEDKFTAEEEAAANQTFFNPKSLTRPDSEREFQDELEYGANIKLSERLKNYKFLKSFAGSTWNKFVE